MRKKVESRYFDISKVNIKAMDAWANQEKLAAALKEKNFKNAEEYARLHFKLADHMQAFMKKNPEFKKLTPQQIGQIFRKYSPRGVPAPADL